MFFSDDYVEEVRSRNDIVDVISGVVALRKKGGRYFGCCPFHNEKTPSFSVSRENQLYHCFGCGVGGNVFTFVMQYENLTFPESIAYLAERAGMDLPEETSTNSNKRREDEKKQQLLAMYKDAASFYYYQLRSPNGKAAMDYFLKRGLTENTINAFGLGYAPKSGSPLCAYLRKKGYSNELLNESNLLKIDSRGAWDRFFNRAMFPIMDIRRRVIAFGGRVMGDGEPKYLNSPESDIFNKSRTLFGLHIAKNSRKNYFLLCEGYMDVISLHQAGFDCAVASLGTAFTSGHASLLKRYGKEVIITYDNDNAGINAARRAIPVLKEAGIHVRVLDMTPYKDPDEFINALSADEFEKRVINSVGAFFFECDQKYKTVDRSDPESLSVFQRSLAGEIASLADALTRENYIQASAARYHIKPQVLSEAVLYIGGRKPPAEAETPARSGRRTGKTGPDPVETYVLNWLAVTPCSSEVVNRYVKPEYFKNELYRAAAERLLSDINEGRARVPSVIIDEYTDDEEKRASLTSAFCSDLDCSDKIAAGYIYRLKKEYINICLRNAVDKSEIEKLAAEKAALDKEPICLSQ